jgi:hypothetical protein
MAWRMVWVGWVMVSERKSMGWVMEPLLYLCKQFIQSKEKTIPYLLNAQRLFKIKDRFIEDLRTLYPGHSFPRGGT